MIRAAIPFQGELAALLAAPPPRALLAGPWLLAFMLAALLGAAAWLRTDIVVTGAGRLTPDAPPLLVQPMDRALLREVLVRPGEVVQAGQVLARLDPTFAAADRAALAAEARSLRAQAARLAAEQAGAPPPPATDAEGRMQAALQESRAAALAARRTALAAEEAALREALSAGTATRAALVRQVATAADVAAMRARLETQQLGSRLQSLAARGSLIEAERALAEAEGRAAELAERAIAAAAARRGLEHEWQRSLAEDAARIADALAGVEEQLAKATRLDALTTLVAPADGVVLEVARRGAGAVLHPAEALVTLVPAGAPMIAEVALRSADVGRVAAGDLVRLKVDAFPFQRHGALEGRLLSISRDSFDPRLPPGAEAAAPPAQAIHRARIAVAPGTLALIPGMTLTAEIMAGTRSVLGFVLEPLARGWNESLREP